MTYHKHEKERFQLLAKLFDMLDKKRATATGMEEFLTLMELLSVDVEEQKKRVQRAHRGQAEGTHSG